MITLITGLCLLIVGAAMWLAVSICASGKGRGDEGELYDELTSYGCCGSRPVTKETLDGGKAEVVNCTRCKTTYGLSHSMMTAESV